MSIVLVVAAHPDDEILGVGGTIARHVANGDKAFALILGEGQTSRWTRRELASRGVVQELHKDTLRAGEIIGYTDVYLENLPDNRFDSIDLLDVVKCVEKYVQELKPDIIYTHHAHDLNIDHQVTSKAVLTATRPIGDYAVKEIYAFETVSSTEWDFGRSETAFIPTLYIDIEEYFDIKCRALEIYKSEMREFPHPRSLKMLEALAYVRGASIGRNYAEAFEVIRIVK